MGIRHFAYTAGPGIPPRAGVGLKADHYRVIIQTRPDIGFFEVHAENYMGEGGPPHRYLTAIRERYPLSLHGVGLSIGAARPLDREHLKRLKMLIERYEPGLFSEHLAWSSHGASYLDDLLPAPYTDETLACVCEHIDDVQTFLGRQMLLENPATYLTFAESTWSEVDFIGEVVRRTGCALLLDVNNVYVAATNHQWDPRAYIESCPLAHVRQIHLAGHATELDEKQRPLLIDTHDRRVDTIVWSLYRQAIELLGPVPTLIEWDANIPAWPALHAEAERAEAIMNSVREDAMPSLSVRLDDFGAALLDPDRAVPAGLVGPDGMTSARRFSVYRNNVVVGLTEALRVSFPCAAKLVGDGFFTAMARIFVAIQPPTSPILLHYGAEFPDFIESFAPAASLPYLADVARIERAATEAYHTRDETPLDPAALAAVPHEQSSSLRFRLHPSVRLLRSRFPAFTIWRMNTADGTPAPVDLAECQDTMVLRPDIEVDVRHVQPGSHDFVAALERGLTLAQATAKALSTDANFDLAKNLRELIQMGVFISFHLSCEESHHE
jgi:uncharacterized protein (UPF0276 family)